jgi:hypothetical protein
MNIAKVKNSADFVNYVKPGLEMVEMDIEGVLCASNLPARVGISGTPGTFTGGSSNRLDVERRPS